MSQRTWLTVIVLVTFIALVPAVRADTAMPVVHENPAGLASQQPFDVNGKLMLQLEQMFGSLDSVALNINLSQFDLSRASMKDFDQYYQFFKDYLGRTSITGSDYQRITGQANVTAEQLRGIIESSDRFNTNFSRFQAFYDAGDMVNATITAVELQKQFNSMNGSSRELKLTAAAIGSLLQNTSVNTNRLDAGINTLNVYMGRMDELNALPMSLLGDTNLTLAASEVNVSTGDIVAFTARVSSSGTAVTGGAIDLYVDGTSVGSMAPGENGTCIIYYRIAPGSFNGIFEATAYFDPQGSGYSPAVSNDIVLYRMPITTFLTMTVAAPETVRFGDTIRAAGRLTADGDYPVPGHIVSVCFESLPSCLAITDINGYYSCDVAITARMPAGFDIYARFDSDSAPGEALANASSATSAIRVLQEGTLLTLQPPPSEVYGGQDVIFTGSIFSSGGRAVGGVEIGIYDDTGLIASNVTDDSGYFSVAKRVNFSDAAGIRHVYAAYRPEAGLVLEGSESDGYDVTFLPITPAIAVSGVPMIAFPGDIVNMSGRAAARDGSGIEGIWLTAGVPNATLGQVLTGENGTFQFLYRINMPAGYQAITVSNGPDSLLLPAAASAGGMYVMPFDLLTCLAIVVIVLLVAGLAITRITRINLALRRRLGGLRGRRNEATLPKPTLKVTPVPEPPEEWGIKPGVTGFEDEVARIGAIIDGGADYRDVIVEIYLAARRITGAHGFAIPESATHREFYRKLIAQAPGLNVPAGTITRHYEAAVFGDKQLARKDIMGSLYSLKEISTLVAGEPMGGGT